MEKVGDAPRAEGMQGEPAKTGLGASSYKSLTDSVAQFSQDVLELAQFDPPSPVVPLCSH